MASFASPASFAEARVSEAPRASSAAHLAEPVKADETPATKAAEKLRNDAAPSHKDTLAPTNLTVRLDEDAGRFVQTFTDVQTNEMLRRYPSDAQLAFSRAVNAYLRAWFGT